MFKLEKEVVDRRDNHSGNRWCGAMQATIVLLGGTTALLFFLLVYIISLEDTRSVLFTKHAGFGGYDTAVYGDIPESSKSQRETKNSDSVMLEPAVQKLVDSIKRATRAANGGSDPTWSEEESEEWKAQYPCRSRDELVPLYARRNHVQDATPNPQWYEVLREYSKLHRTCLRRAGDLTASFEGHNSTTGCKFLIADVMWGTGLGNKVLVVVSNLLYAILTQRVMLLPVPTLLPFIMCEPFEGSTWRIDNSSLPFPPSNHPKQWQFPESFYRDLDRSKMASAAEKKKKVSIPYASAVTFESKKIRDQWHPRERFYCSTEQERYRNIPWLYISGCLYTLPNLFAIGSFRPTLEALFPDKMALTHILRSLMLPADTVWDRAKRISDAYLMHADKRVGIQVRYKDGLPHYNQDNDLYNERITRCALENRILPNVSFSIDSRIDDSHVEEVAPAKPKVITVFIACLYTGLHDHLTRLFLRHPATTGESIGLVQVTHEDVQEFGVEVDRQALAEVLALSFSDDIIVTPISTYGGLAQAYGALRPWFIEIRKKSPKACTRGPTVDICYQDGSPKYSCPHEEDIDGKAIADVVPYLRPCLVEDFPKGGVQLITD